MGCCRARGPSPKAQAKPPIRIVGRIGAGTVLRSIPTLCPCCSAYSLGCTCNTALASIYNSTCTIPSLNPPLCRSGGWTLTVPASQGGSTHSRGMRTVVPVTVRR